MKWNKNKIISDLQQLIDNKGTITEEQYPQGERYCRDLFIKPTKESNGDGISIAGFNEDDISDVDNPNEDIKYVEIRNFNSDDEGGLDKHASKQIRELYYIAVDYFNNEDIEVIDNLHDFF